MTDATNNGIIEVAGPDTTVPAAVERLTAAIEANPKLRLVATVDHAAGAESVGQTLPPTVELMFGNPAMGTPLMTIARSAAIDLPQKMVITQGDDGVRVLFNDPQYLAARHGIAEDTPQLAAARTALDALAATAAGVDS